MEKVLAILQERGITSADAVEKAFRGPLKNAVELKDELRDALKPDYRSDPTVRAAPPDPFTFIASGIVRGDHACMEWGCRLKRTRLLARYSALYCDRVLFPLYLANPEMEQNGEWHERYALAGTLLSVLVLKPLVEQGIVEFVPDHFQLCPQHLEECVPAHARIVKAASRLATSRSTRFRVSYKPPTDRVPYPSLSVNGPTDYLEHGKFIRVLDHVPEWAPRRHSGPTTAEMRLPQRTVRASGIVKSIFEEMANDLYLQQFYGIRQGAKYLAGLKGEVEFLRAVSGGGDAEETRTASACAELTHTIPIMANTSIDTILRIRADDYQPFLVYRDALRKIVADYIRANGLMGAADASGIYNDVLLPEIQKLEAKAKTQYRAAWKKFGVKAGVSAAVVGFGVFGGLLPTELAHLFQTVGGVGLLKEIGEALASIERNPTEIRDHNFYFLLRLKQSAGRN